LKPFSLSPDSRTGHDVVIDDVCVMFALRREAGPFCRDFHPNQSLLGAPCWAKFCGPSWLPVLALATGVGQARTERALTWLLGEPHLGDIHYRPKLVIAAGFCGALDDSLKTGDIVLATEVLDQSTGASWSTTWPPHPLSGRREPPLHLGRMVSVPHLAATPKEKRALGKDLDAMAVDMESATLARMCHRAQVPFGCVRVVLDDQNTLLSPKLVGLLSSASASPWRVALATASSPALLPELRRLARRSHFAATQLGKALGELLTLTLPWMYQ
jgi:adenosylhomocysteine nucleosidase